MISMYCTLALTWIVTLGAVPPGLAVELTSLSSAPHYPEIPILLQVNVVNRGEETVTIPAPSLSARDNPYHTIEIYAGPTAASMTPIRYVIPDFSPWKEGLAPTLPEELTLAAGEAWTEVVVLSHDWQTDAVVSLLQGKALHLEARYCGWGDKGNTGEPLDRIDTRNSGTLEIPFVATSGAAATALSKLRRLEKPWLLAHPAAVLHVTQDKDFRGFQELARMSSASPYTAWAQMVVAYMMAEGNALDLYGSRPPQPRVAAMWMDQALKNHRGATRHPEWSALKKRLDLVIATDTSTQQTEDNAPSL